MGWLYSEGRADAHLQLEQQLLERLAPKSPLVSKLHYPFICDLTAYHSQSCCFLHMQHVVIIDQCSAQSIAGAPTSGPQSATVHHFVVIGWHVLFQALYAKACVKCCCCLQTRPASAQVLTINHSATGLPRHQPAAIQTQAVSQPAVLSHENLPMQASLDSLLRLCIAADT